MTVSVRSGATDGALQLNGVDKIALKSTGAELDASPAAGDNSLKIATTGFVTAENNLKAWVNFNGTGTVTIRASKNISSITDNGVGNYTVNMTDALVDANYNVHISTQGTTTASIVGESAVYTASTTAFSTPTTSAFQFTTWNSAVSGLADTAYIMVAVFR